MKTFVYHFDPTDKFYLGADEADVCQITGQPLIPGSATLQAPPSFDIGNERIAVFVSEEQGWTIAANNFWRPAMVRYQPVLGNPMTGRFSIIQYPAYELLKYPGIPRVMAPMTVGMALSGRLTYMQKRLEEVIHLYQERAQSVAPYDLVYEKIATEDLVLQMKRVVDEIFMNEWIRLEEAGQKFAEEHIIRVRAVNEVDSAPAGPTKTHLINMRDEDPMFFTVLTDLRNSFAHHFPVAEVYNLIGIDHLTVNTLYVKNGDVNTVRLIEVWLEDLVRSFNRFMVRTFGAPISGLH
ncbi:hypothetical protein [Pseudomonas putida]|uniref:ApeA N-terminal domain-containing protein n=1 Tax=Pseudomonas putida TaxID=303 RepID=A0AAW6PS66_PSEPU|nr:hypothetical protein [Pseudomonas putida]MDF3872966.1 hypothetical protein [Pseudomonas putida]MDF3879197.1 hypothetical protein [Pseudomonas putida]